MESPHPAGGLQIVQVRVYYDGASGEVIHVHRLVASPGDAPLSEERITEEMAAFETSVRERHGRALEYLVVDEASLRRASAAPLRVDLGSRRRLIDDPVAR